MSQPDEPRRADLAPAPDTPLAVTRFTSPPQDPDQTVPPEAEVERPREVPARAERYVIEGEIGRGGMGVVLRVRDTLLGRSLAVKALREGHKQRPELVRRFLEEARLMGQLQHPGVPPVHDLGELPDGRPFFAMKLIKGRTLADLLKERGEPVENLPHLLGVFEQVCQTLAYAHSKGVLHRDLKPANIMVGAFGEVQVMDWGLAKLQQPAGGAEGRPREADTEAESVLSVRVRGDDPFTQTGSVLGTPAYMAPEQARGEVADLDERADVFGLGAVLSVILTGQPPYAGSDAEETHRRAMRGDLGGAFVRLDCCGADPELVALAKACLAPGREGRPRDAEAVAAAMTAYQRGVQERLRQAELERARAEVKVEEERKQRRLAEALAAGERKRRRLTLGLAAALLLLVTAGGGGAWWLQQQRAEQEAAVARQQEQIDASVAGALGQVRLLYDQARATFPPEPVRYRVALSTADGADKLAREGPASPELREQAAEIRKEIENELAAAEKDRRLLAAVLEVRRPRETPTFRRDKTGPVTQEDLPDDDELFGRAFADWGLDIDRLPVAEAAARLGRRPQRVQDEVVAALDDWANARRRHKRPRGEWLPLVELADKLDRDPRRKELRALLGRGRLRAERLRAALAEGLLPWSVLAGLEVGEDRKALRRLARATNAERMPVLSVLLLAKALHEAGEADAERLFRSALLARPEDVTLLSGLGVLLEEQRPPRWKEAAECYAAARAVRRDLGGALARALKGDGRPAQALALLGQLVREDPDNPWRQGALGLALKRQGNLKEAGAAFRRAIELAPKDPRAYNNLGLMLQEQGDLEGALAYYHKAAEVDRRHASAFNNIGGALYHRKDRAGAIAAFREAIEIDKDYATAHFNLGVVLALEKDLVGAIDAFRKAAKSNPDDAFAHYNLGVVLQDRKDLAGAIVAYRRATAADPRYANAYDNLGLALYAAGDFAEAAASFRREIELRPRDAKPYSGLGAALSELGDVAGAIAAFRTATRIDPSYADAHFNLGLLLWRRRDVAGSVAALRRATEIDPSHADAHGALGRGLLRQGDFEGARASIRRALRLLPPDVPLRRHLGEQLRKCERMLLLEPRLPAVLAGKEQPQNPREYIELAQLCGHYKKRHVAAVRLFTAAFTAEPKLAADLRMGLRFDAACAAVLASDGQGTDAATLDCAERARLRRRAFDWLRTDLDARTKQPANTSPQARLATRRALSHLQKDADLAGVRDNEALARLPLDERKQWQQLWADVEALRKRVADTDDRK